MRKTRHYQQETDKQIVTTVNLKPTHPLVSMAQCFFYFLFIFYLLMAHHETKIFFKRVFMFSVSDIVCIFTSSVKAIFANKFHCTEILFNSSLSSIQ